MLFRHAARKWSIRALSVAAVFLCACSGASDSPPKGADSASGSDDFDTAEGVPMALLGGDVLAQVLNGLPGDTAPPSATAPLEVGILEAPGRAATDLRGILLGVQALFDDTFGASGYFRAKDVKLPRSGRRVFANASTGDAPAFLVVRRAAADSGYRYAVDFVARDGAGSLSTTTSVDFSPEGASGVSFRVQHSAPLAEGGRRRLDARYDSRAVGVDAVFGRVPALATAPAKTLIHFLADADGVAADLAGGYVWARGTTVPPETLAPRYAQLVDGDRELFQARIRQDATAATVQRLAFVPVDAAKTVGDMPDAKVFDDHSYPPLALAYLVQALRSPKVDAGCSGFGDQLRALFAKAGAVPPAVASLPADVCAATAATSDQALAAAVLATCAAGLEVALEVPPGTTDGKDGELRVCERYAYASLLANPQRLLTRDDKRVLVQKEADAVPAHAQLAQELAAKPFVDISALSEPAWPDAAAVAAADVANAAARPE